MEEYETIKVINASVENQAILVGKYGIYLSGYRDGRNRIEVDNVEYLVSAEDINTVDDSYVVFDLEYSGFYKGWSIRTPNCKMGVNKEKIFCECSFEELFVFSSFAAAQQHIEENFEIVQIGKVNVKNYEEDSA